MKRLHGLDAVRFLCALTVVLSHIEPLPLFGPGATGFGLLFSKGVRVLFNGPGAVIVFFVLSGLVIHFHALGSERIGPSFFVRRYLRIAGPMLAGFGVATLVGYGAMSLVNGVMWSLWCELIYYTLYPLLRWLGRRFGWRLVIAISLVPSYAATILYGHGDIAFGDWKLDWLVGLPCWLAGCWAAEQIAVARRTGVQQIWMWRLAIYFGSVVTLILRFHSPIAYGYSLVPYSFAVTAWLLREIAYYSEEGRRPWAWIEAAGAWSYSLYVSHPIVGRWLEVQFLKTVGKHRMAFWTLTLFSSLLLGYVFSLAFERPSHRLARALARYVRDRWEVGPKLSPVKPAPSAQV